VTYQLTPALGMGITGKHVGQQFIDYENSEDLRIPQYQLLNMALNYERSRFEISAKINNILDENYATYGYAWGDGYYWPGATRNYSLSLNYSFQ
jgi:outer membrane receptor protein involved in Fe transport